MADDLSKAHWLQIMQAVVGKDRFEAAAAMDRPASLRTAASRLVNVRVALETSRQILHATVTSLLDSGAWSGRGAEAYRRLLTEFDKVIRLGLIPLNPPRRYDELLNSAADKLEWAINEIIEYNYHGAAWTKNAYDELKAHYDTAKYSKGDLQVQATATLATRQHELGIAKPKSPPERPWVYVNGKPMFTPQTYPLIDNWVTASMQMVYRELAAEFGRVVTALELPSASTAPAPGGGQPSNPPTMPPPSPPPAVPPGSPPGTTPPAPGAGLPGSQTPNGVPPASPGSPPGEVEAFGAGGSDPEPGMDSASAGTLGAPPSAPAFSGQMPAPTVADTLPAGLSPSTGLSALTGAGGQNGLAGPLLPLSPPVPALTPMPPGTPSRSTGPGSGLGEPGSPWAPSLPAPPAVVGGKDGAWSGAPAPGLPRSPSSVPPPGALPAPNGSGGPVRLPESPPVAGSFPHIGAAPASSPRLPGQDSLVVGPGGSGPPIGGGPHLPGARHVPVAAMGAAAATQTPPGAGPGGYGGMPYPMMPMGGMAAPSKNNEERERETWLLEDRPVWSAATATAPRVVRGDREASDEDAEAAAGTGGADRHAAVAWASGTRTERPDDQVTSQHGGPA